MNELLYLIFNSIIFIFPAFVANASPTILGKGNRFNGPIDGGRFWKDNKRILGDGKTIRGFISGTISGMVTCIAIIIIANQIVYPLAFMTYLEKGFLYNILQPMSSILLYNEIVLGSLVGFLLGCGALIGDLSGSFIKRRSGLKRGESYPFMDQLGFLVIALIFVYLIIPWPIIWLVFLVPLTLGFHVSMNILSYTVGIQEVPF